MKKTIFILFLLASVSISAQGEFYVGLHYFKVKSEYAEEFIEAEKNYYSKIHKARIDSGDKIAWDMWRLQNNDMNNSETIFVFAHLQDINMPFRMGNPNKMFSESELKIVKKQRRNMVLGTKFVQTVFKGGFVPSDGTPPKIAILNFIDAKAGKWYDLENTLKNEISSENALQTDVPSTPRSTTSQSSDSSVTSKASDSSSSETPKVVKRPNKMFMTG